MATGLYAYLTKVLDQLLNPVEKLATSRVILQHLSTPTDFKLDNRMGRISMPKLLPLPTGSIPDKPAINELGEAIRVLSKFLTQSGTNCVALTGAGISVDSGIRAYRSSWYPSLTHLCLIDLNYKLTLQICFLSSFWIFFFSLVTFLFIYFVWWYWLVLILCLYSGLGYIFTKGKEWCQLSNDPFYFLPRDGWVMIIVLLILWLWSKRFMTKQANQH